MHPITRRLDTHQGVDFVTAGDKRVRAAAAGEVLFAGWRSGYGNLVILRHNNGYSTRYAHLSGFASGVKRGDRVSQGDVIGFVGATGLATGPIGRLVDRVPIGRAVHHACVPEDVLDEAGATKVVQTFLDTGAMYRCVALTALRRSVDPYDALSVEEIAAGLDIQIGRAHV